MKWLVDLLKQFFVAKIIINPSLHHKFLISMHSHTCIAGPREKVGSRPLASRYLRRGALRSSAGPE
jgi:hypothetical protein